MWSAYPNRFGEQVVAVIELHAEATRRGPRRPPAGNAFAPCKLPRHLIRVGSVGRAPNGKADYAGARQLALDLLAGSADAHR
ncbi:MAG: hypothetical protein U5R31_17665 [Acidimicrobiia bacterium]|nr:hypothetical protein [Acidimicrobiia bacterium]